MNGYNYLIHNIKIKPSKEKEIIANDYMHYDLIRLLTMFKWSGKDIGDTVDEKFLELITMTNGSGALTEIDGKFYFMQAGLGGEPDHNYMPTIAIFANPALKFNKELKIHEDCEVLYNDGLGKGLIPLLSRYANAMSENYITLKLADIWARATALISASDDTTKASAEEFIEKLIKGELSVIGSEELFEGIKSQPLHNGANSELTNILEVQQYLKASKYNELGLNANFNMKREAIMGDEASMNNDILSPLVDQMLKERQEFCDRVNRLYPEANWTVEFNPEGAWGQRERIEEAEAEMIEAEVEQVENDEIESEEEQYDDNDREDEKSEDIEQPEK